jgi:hypothetical protein
VQPGTASDSAQHAADRALLLAHVLQFMGEVGVVPRDTGHRLSLSCRPSRAQMPSRAATERPRARVYLVEPPPGRPLLSTHDVTKREAEMADHSVSTRLRCAELGAPGSELTSSGSSPSRGANMLWSGVTVISVERPNPIASLAGARRRSTNLSKFSFSSQISTIADEQHGLEEWLAAPEAR